MSDLTIVVPVYNDRESVLPLKEEIGAALADAPFTYDLLFVDDGSTDNPREVFEAHGLRFLSHGVNRGYGAAIKTGVQAADSEFVCIIDCDGTYDFSNLTPLIEPLDEGYDMVVGNRLTSLLAPGAMPWAHRSAHFPIPWRRPRPSHTCPTRPRSRNRPR